jgi:hypothetical protein
MRGEWEELRVDTLCISGFIFTFFFFFLFIVTLFGFKQILFFFFLFIYHFLLIRLWIIQGSAGWLIQQSAIRMGTGAMWNALPIPNLKELNV